MSRHLRLGFLDVVSTLADLLGSVGYVFCNGDAESGKTDGDGMSADWWFTWAGPGMSECECGPTCGSWLEAVDSAQRYWFESACIALDSAD